MRALGRFVALCLGAAALIALLSACGDQVGLNRTEARGTRTYTNVRYGFSITYDRRFSAETDSRATVAGPTSPVVDIGFVDTNGTEVNSAYVNGIEVAVAQLTRAVRPEEVPKLKHELEGVFEQLRRSCDDMTVVRPLAPLRLNGIPGYSISYTYSLSGTMLKAVSYTLIRGRYEYQVIAQAAEDEWPTLQPRLDAAVQSFTLK